MPRIRKAEITRKTTEKQFVFDEFRLYKGNGENELTALESLNCDCADSALAPSPAWGTYQLPSGVSPELLSQMKAFHVANIKDADNGRKAAQELYITDSLGNTQKYYEELGGFVTYISDFPTTKVLTLWEKGKGATKIFVSPTKIYAQAAGSDSFETLCAEGRGLACICANRIFYVYKDHDIAYTNPAEPLDTAESVEGYGVLYSNEKDGYAQGLVALGDSVIVLYENGLKRIDVAGSPKEFVAQPIEYNGGKVYYNTACVCENAVFFLAADGVYRYDGKEVKRVCENLPIFPAEDDGNCRCARFYREYMLSYYDKNRGNRLVVIRGDGKSGYFGEFVTGLSANAETPLAQKGTALCVYSREASRAHYDSYFVVNYTDFGTPRKKTLKAITLYGEGVVQITVSRIDGLASPTRGKYILENGVCATSVMERSTAFAFNIQMEAGARIEKIVFDVVYF